ncbi:MAG TPA: thioredoxin domain-containing protein [Negativicutes bacterium]|nr:thioredoxin domain-containing protein [Negativicutes bacterium]
MDQKTNQLIKEKSPYLLQHAHNPVDWHPWGDAAFAKAKTEDKPIFLSIGYSTCHWCHVMAHESFEDQDVADVLNAHFISIKVDKEERPDIDSVYMLACQAATGHGGWPLTIIMTPDGKPFFAGTYLPKSRRWGKPGLVQVLDAVRKQWQGNRKDLLTYAEKVTSFVREAQTPPKAEVKLSPDVLHKGFTQLSKNFDHTYGGFGQAPKFPSPHNLLFLLNYYRRTQEDGAITMVEKTLHVMRAGGIYDHIGYGFSRYSVDAKWIVPHFEKMLYDNALLAYTYLDATEVTGKKKYAQVAEEVLTYVLRDLSGSQGEFYSAEDADSEGGEGRFYTWSEDELIETLGSEKAALFGGYYNVSSQGNFEHGTNILQRVGGSLTTYAATIKRTESELVEILEECRKKMLIRRNKRQRPFRDDKVLTAWNCLMVVSLAKAARVLDRAMYRVAAEKCLAFMEKNLRRDDGRLMAAYRNGEVQPAVAYLDDYAFMLWALLELHDTAPTLEILSKATVVADEMIRLFWDETQDGFFFTGSDSEILLVRTQEWIDAEMPSGNSVAARMLLRLTKKTGQGKYRELSARMLNRMAGELSRSPMAYAFLLTACDELLSQND